MLVQSYLSRKNAKHFLWRELLGRHPPLKPLAGVVKKLIERVAVGAHAPRYLLQMHTAQRGQQGLALLNRQLFIYKASERCHNILWDVIRSVSASESTGTPTHSLPPRIASSSETSRHLRRRISAKAVRTQIL